MYDMGPNTDDSSIATILAVISGVIAALITKAVADNDGNEGHWTLGAGIVVGALIWVLINWLDRDQSTDDDTEEATYTQKVAPSLVNPGPLPAANSVVVPDTVEEMFPDLDAPTE